MEDEKYKEIENTKNHFRLSDLSNALCCKRFLDYCLFCKTCVTSSTYVQIPELAAKFLIESLPSADRFCPTSNATPA